MKSTLSKIAPPAIKHYIAARSRKKNKSFFENDFLGEKLKILDADDLSRRWYQKPWSYESRSEFQVFQGMGLPQDATVFDIGAHQGIVSILLSRLIVPGGRVVAIEMDELNAYACSENIKANAETNITCINAAISDEVGWIRHTGRSNASIAPNSALSFLLPRTKTTTIDRLCDRFGVPDLIYLDVEGAEILALKSALNALGKTYALFIELHGDDVCRHFGGRNTDVFTTLLDFGYRLMFAPSEDASFSEIGKDFDYSGRGFIIAELKDS